MSEQPTPSPESPAPTGEHHHVTAAWFFTASLAAAIANGVVSVLLARQMSINDFGLYSLVVAILGTSAMFFEFGLFTAAGREVTTVAGEDRRSIVGSAVLLYLPMGLSYLAFLIVTSYAFALFWGETVGHVVRVAAPLAIMIPFKFAAQELAQGLGRLRTYSSVLFTNSVIALGAVVTYIEYFDGKPSPLAAAILYTGAALVTFLFLPFLLHPRIANVGTWIPRILGAAKAYGFPAYIGRIVSTGTYRLDVLLVATFASRGDVGFYSLASAGVMPISLLAVAFASARFPEMAHQRSLPSRWVSLNAVVMGICVASVVILGPFLVRVVLGARFAEVATLAIPLAAAEALRGCASLLNRFLLAHAEGRTLRNAALVFTVSNVIANLALIPPFGARGAAFASVLALAVNLAARSLSYTRLKARLATTV